MSIKCIDFRNKGQTVNTGFEKRVYMSKFKRIRHDTCQRNDME